MVLVKSMSLYNGCYTCLLCNDRYLKDGLQVEHYFVGDVSWPMLKTENIYVQGGKGACRVWSMSSWVHFRVFDKQVVSGQIRL